MPCGMARPVRPTGSRWSAPACSACWWRGCAPGYPAREVTVVDINPARAAIAAAFGAGFAVPDQAPGDCDLVVHTSASAAGLATALRLAGDEATVLELSWYGADEVKVPLGDVFHSRRLKLISSQVGKVAPSHRPRWDYRRRLTAALDLLNDPLLDALIAPPVAFADLPAQLPAILDPESGVLCQLIRYSMKEPPCTPSKFPTTS